MNASTLRRLSGLATIAAGPLCVIGGLLHPVVEGQAHSPAALATSHTLGSGALLAGTVLLLLGLPGVYGRIGARLGVLGLVGYVLYFLGNLLSAVPHLVLMTFAAGDVAHDHAELVSAHDAVLGVPAFEAEQLVSGFALMIGLLVFGVALVRSRAVPRWVGWTGVAGGLVMLVPIPATPVVSGLQIELLRAVMVVALGVLAVRDARASIPGGRVPSQDRLAAAGWSH